MNEVSKEELVAIAVENAKKYGIIRDELKKISAPIPDSEIDRLFENGNQTSQAEEA